MTFYIEITTNRTEAELVADCGTCGAMTYLPLAYAWTARSVSCCECETRMPVYRSDAMKLKRQAVDTVVEIERLLQLP